MSTDAGAIPAGRLPRRVLGERARVARRSRIRELVHGFQDGLPTAVFPLWPHLVRSRASAATGRLVGAFVPELV